MRKNTFFSEELKTSNLKLKGWSEEQSVQQNNEAAPTAPATSKKVKIEFCN